MSSIDNLIKIISQDTSALDLDRIPKDTSKSWPRNTSGKKVNSKKCFCVKDGMRHEFVSMSELASYLGVSPASVSGAVRRGGTTGGVVVGRSGGSSC